MAMDALERLFEDAKNSSKNQGSQYSLEEQLDVDDDFLGVMSNSSKDTLLSRIHKVDLDESPELTDDFDNDVKFALDYNSVNESTEETKTEDNTLFGKVELDTVEENKEIEEEVENEEVEEEENEEPQEPAIEHKRGRGRPRKKPLEDSDSTKSSIQSTQKPSVNINSIEEINSLNDFMDSLAKDLINELRESNYKTRNFNKKQMNVILDYLENKI